MRGCGRWWPEQPGAHQPPFFFPPLSRCDRAEPAAVLLALLVRPSLRTLDAAFAAFAEVTFLAIERSLYLRAPRRRPARIALQARPIPHKREVAAFAAGVALIAL